jgi:ribonuclease-3
VLNLAVSELLFERFAGSDEGDLTRVRAHLVREDSLHRAALGWPARGGAAVRRRGARRRRAAPSILADALEALIGATFSTAASMPRTRLVRRCSAS